MQKPTFDNRENEHITFEKDGEQREAWLSRSVAVVPHILIQSQGQVFVLMNKRGSGAADNHGRWVLPCGYLDWDETGAEACRREIWEECRLDISSLYQRGHIVYDGFAFDRPWHVVTNPNRDARQNVSLHYGLCIDIDPAHEWGLLHSILPTKEDLKDCDEVDEVAWVNIQALPTLDIAFNHGARVEQFIQSLHP